jgi:hypothetical protein
MNMGQFAGINAGICSEKIRKRFVPDQGINVSITIHEYTGYIRGINTNNRGLAL